MEVTLKNLLNKAGIFLLCSYFFIGYAGISLTNISILLAAFFISCLCSCSDHPAFLGLLCWGFSFAGLWISGPGFFLPVLIYDGIRCYQKLTLPPLLFCSCCTCILLPSIAFPYGMLLLLSGGISLYCQRMDKLYQELHRIRDEGKEKTLAMRQRNQALIEKQNADIHAATLAERNRIAREIHDNVGHMLTRSILQVGALKVLNKTDSLQKPIEDLQETLNTAMTSVRTSVHDLHEDAIDLSSVLRELTESVISPSITLNYDMGRHVPREIKYAFIAIVKEAINNMQKHSNATTAQIQLREHPGFYLLHIADNGTKINRLSGDGIGLSNMEERIRSLGGTIRFDTEEGFKISIMIRRHSPS